MELRKFQNFSDFSSNCKSWLEEWSLHNNMIMGALSSGAGGKDNPGYFAFMDGKNILAVAMLQNERLFTGYNLNYQENTIALVSELISHGVKFKSLLGVSSMVDSLHFTSNVKYDMLLQTCKRVSDIGSTSGQLREAGSEDLSWLIDWIYLFWQQVHIFPKPDRQFAVNQAREKIAQHCLFIWEEQGEPCAIGAVMRQINQTAYIGIIYTPEEKRGHGHGLQLSHALTALLLRRNFSEIALFSEKDNVVSNKIYRKVGFHVVDQFTDLHLS